MKLTKNQLTADLNPQQVQAVEYKGGPLLILAGAGTGKTRVITHRIAHLISTGVQPWNILAVTFTNKAAGEMKERVSELTGEPGKSVLVSTFHSFCNYMLRRDIENIGDYRRGFSIYDETDSRSCIKNILKQMELPSSGSFSPASIRSLISRGKNFQTTPAEYVKAGDRLCDFIDSIAERYQKILEHNNALDFDDLLILAVRLLSESSEVRDRYRNRFKHILVDEYQDTNIPQYKLLKSLAAPDGNITVVGDLDQSIYGWRGANADNMFDFERDFKDASVITLEQNYRSVQSILDAANSLIANNRSIREKFLWSELGDGEKIYLFTPWDERQEAGLVALEIDYLLGKGHQLNDIAVTFRTKAQSRVLEETLLRAAVPHMLIGATAFYQRREIKDMVAYLRVIENPRDFTAFERIVNVPKRGIGAKTLQTISDITSKHEHVLKLLDDKGKSADGLPKRAVEIISILKKLHKTKSEHSIPDLISEIMKLSGYRAFLEDEAQKEDTMSRLENVEELANIATEYIADTKEPTLEGFLSSIALMSDTDVEDFGEGKVKLITLHSAKGLEFPVVFVCGVEEGLLPHNNSIEENQVEEERRLCYVGVTRAKKLLYLSCCRSRLRFGSVVHFDPSRFIYEIGEEHFEHLEGPRGGSGDESFFDEDDLAKDAARSAAMDTGQNNASNYRGNSSGASDRPFGYGGGVRFGKDGGAPKEVFPSDKNETVEESFMTDDDYIEDDLSGSAGGFKPGQFVIHQAFGRGCVMSIKHDEIEISFPGMGVKSFSLEYAPIRKA